MTTGLSGLITFENEYENKCGLACQIYNYSSIFGENFMSICLSGYKEMKLFVSDVIIPFCTSL